jgi:Calcineurin-like phosphoesterase superfamily domain
MRLGLLADIHEHVVHLTRALELFRDHGVERIVVLGDVFCHGRNIRPTVDVLAPLGSIGIWGNHDFGLCRDIPQRCRDKYAGPVLDYFATLKPRLEIDDCLFTHVPPYRDPEDVLQLWHIDEEPAYERDLEQSFAAMPHRMMFMGHWHRWVVATPAGVLAWRGESPIRLTGGRHLVVVHAVMDGYAAVYDTQTAELIPLQLGGGVTPAAPVPQAG